MSLPTEDRRYALEIAAFTHGGRVRPYHEDCMAIGPRIYPIEMSEVTTVRHEIGAPIVCLVADGMGGHAAGEIASRYVAEHLSSALAEGCGDDALLSAIVREVNHGLFNEMRRDPENTGMGTTVAGIIFERDNVTVFNVGDSRVYRCDNGLLGQLSIDDVPRRWMELVGLQMRTGELTQCLGGAPVPIDIDTHIVRERPAPGRTYLICSDGLYDMVPDQVIAACLVDNLSEAVTLLFQKAITAGGEDNLSIMLARVEELPRDA